MSELKNVRVWWDPNTGRLQVTAQVEPVGRMDVELKHATLRLEYGGNSYAEHSIKAHPRRRSSDD